MGREKRQSTSMMTNPAEEEGRRGCYGEEDAGKASSMKRTSLYITKGTKQNAEWNLYGDDLESLGNLRLRDVGPWFICNISDSSRQGIWSSTG